MPVRKYKSATDTLFWGDVCDVLTGHVAPHSVDLVVADPPYNIGKQFATTRDRWPDDASYLAWCVRWLDLCVERLTPTGSLYLMASTQSMPLLDLHLRRRMHVLSRIVWHYDSSGVQARRRFGSMYEPILHCVQDPSRYTFEADAIRVEAPTGARRRLIDHRKPVPAVYASDKVPGNVWYFPRVRYRSPEYEEHPTQKPEALLGRIIAASSRPGDTVADFFCGSGTALVAAAELGRRFIGCDCALPAVELAHARLLELRMDVPEDMTEKPGAVPGVSFDRCGLGLTERRLWLGEGGAGEHVARLLRHHGATPLAEPGALHGLRGEVGEVGVVGVVVGPWDAPLARAAVQAALREAAARKLGGLDVLAWAWEFPADEDLSAGTGIALTCLQLRRELLDDRALAREDGGLGERPSLRFEWRAGPEQTVQLVLCGAALRRPERLAPDLRAAFADWRELVESWSVEFASTGGPLRPGQRHHRTRNQRSLVCESAPARCEGPGPFWARVEVVDRLGAAHPLDFTLTWPDGQLKVVQGPPEAS